MADSAVKIPFTEAAAPSTPATGKVVIYAKTDGLLYSKDDAGTETLVSGGSGATTPPNCYTAVLTADVTIVNANTAYDGPTITPAAGDYFVIAEADVSSANAAATGHTIRIEHNGTVIKARATWHTGGAGGGSSLSVSARMTADGVNPIKLQCLSTRGSSDSVIKDQALNNGTADKCTSITAIRITSV